MNKIVLSEGTLQRAGGGENRCGELERMGLGDALVNILWLSKAVSGMSQITGGISGFGYAFFILSEMTVFL